MKKTNYGFLVFVYFFFISVAVSKAQTARDTLMPVSKEQVNQIAGKLIAPCCWTQTVDVHQSSAAEKIKIEIRAALERGQSEEEIIDHFVAEYGKRILAEPKAAGFDLMLWILPTLILIFGSFIVFRILRYVTQKRNAAKVSEEPLIDDAVLKRAENELKEFDK